MLLLSSVFMTDMFTQGLRGEIVQYVISYFLVTHEAWEVREMIDAFDFDDNQHLQPAERRALPDYQGP